MGVEIERKFIVVTTKWTRAGSGTRIVQGYLNSDKARTVRVRIEGEEARITVKGASQGFARAEYEYPIPLADAREILDDLCERPFIDKTRHRVDYGGRTWEIDVFHGDNEGLVMAEVELESEDAVVELPPWAGREVSRDRRYFNSNLAREPWPRWKDEGS